MAKQPEVFKIPSTLAECADLLYTTRMNRYAAQRAIKVLEERETALREHIIREMTKEQTSVGGRTARVTRTEKDVAQVTDWPKFYAYIKRHSAWELLQKRVSDPAVQERWDAKKKVPGVEPFTVVGLSVEKL